MVSLSCWYFVLTHCGLVTLYGDRSGSTLAQVMACCLMAPSHYLNQCWLMISDVLWHSPDSNFTKNKILIVEMSWKFTKIETGVKSPRGQWVNVKVKKNAATGLGFFRKKPISSRTPGKKWKKPISSSFVRTKLEETGQNWKKLWKMSEMLEENTYHT